MKRYLVTGAAGFIASKVVEILLEGGSEVIGIDNLNDAYDRSMKDYRLSQLQRNPGFQFHKNDIGDKSILQSPYLVGKKIDAVINLAARAGVRASVENPWIYLDTNCVGTLNLLELCLQEGIKKFVLASSSSVYGLDAPQPTPETAPTNKPLQTYAASKKAAEVTAYAYHHLHGIDVSVLRYFTVYGPAGRPDMVMFRFIKWIQDELPVHLNGDGNQSRGFTYLDDIAQGTVMALQPLGYEIFNLGGHEPITMNDLIKHLENITAKKADIIMHPRHPADVLTNLADVNKAKRILGWEPQVSLRNGIEQTVEWYLQEHSWAKDIRTE